MFQTRIFRNFPIKNVPVFRNFPINRAKKKGRGFPWPTSLTDLFQRLRQLVGAGGRLGSRSRALDALEQRDDVLDLAPFAELGDALGIARAAAGEGHLLDDAVLVDDIDAARTDVLRLIGEGLFHQS